MKEQRSLEYFGDTSPSCSGRRFCSWCRWRELGGVVEDVPGDTSLTAAGDGFPSLTPASTTAVAQYLGDTSRKASGDR